jgi:hypothetical protein
LKTKLPMQSFYRIGTVGLRVIRQIKRDKRTIGLVIVSPIILNGPAGLLPGRDHERH